MKELTKTLENSRNYTLQVAEAMPEKSYTYKPVKEVWSFGELMNHIAYGIQWWEENFIKETKTEWSPPAPLTDKKKVTALLTKAYDDLKKTVSHTLTPEQVKGFYTTLDHITHHRGQAVTYLRENGVVPPEYVY